MAVGMDHFHLKKNDRFVMKTTAKKQKNETIVLKRNRFSKTVVY